MAIWEYLNKTTPASPDEAIAPSLPEGHTVSTIRPATAQEEPAEIDYADAIGKKGYYGFFKDMYKKPDFEKEEKATRHERTLALLGDIANLGVQMFSSGRGARQFAPINSQVPKYNERLRRLRDAKRVNDAEYQNKSLSMIFNDYEQKRAEEERARQLRAAAEKEAYNRQWNQFKYNSDLEYKKEKDKATAAAKEKELAERKRHNEAVEANGRTNAAANLSRANGSKGNNRNEIAYVTKYGNVIFDNPKNKRAATLSTLEVMRNGASGEKRETIDSIIQAVRNGEVDSYNKAEMYVSQNLNSDAVALRHLYELAGKYGRVESVASQRQSRDNARGKTGWSLFGPSNNSSTNGGWSLK